MKNYSARPSPPTPQKILSRNFPEFIPAKLQKLFFF